MARVMLSAGMFDAFALSRTVRRRGLESGSPPPIRAAIVISRISFVKTLPRFASSAPFLCLMVCHLECPDIWLLLQRWVEEVYTGERRRAQRKKKPRSRGPGLSSMRKKSRQRPTLPPGRPDSTIGAGGLNGRVRNGNGCDPSAMVTGMKLSSHRHRRIILYEAPRRAAFAVAAGR